VLLLAACVDCGSVPCSSLRLLLCGLRLLLCAVSCLRLLVCAVSVVFCLWLRVLLLFACLDFGSFFFCVGSGCFFLDVMDVMCECLQVMYMSCMCQVCVMYMSFMCYVCVMYVQCGWNSSIEQPTCSHAASLRVCVTCVCELLFLVLACLLLFPSLYLSRACLSLPLPFSPFLTLSRALAPWRTATNLCPSLVRMPLALACIRTIFVCVCVCVCLSRRTGSGFEERASSVMKAI